MDLQMLHDALEEYMASLEERELAETTRKKYYRDIIKFLRFFWSRQSIAKADIVEYKKYLLRQYNSSSVNSYLIALNSYLHWLGRHDLAIKTVRLQRRFNLENVLNEKEYRDLLDCCLHNSQERNYLLLRTLAGTGIRVGELSCITVEATATQTAHIYHKAKARCVLLTSDLSTRLMEYSLRNGIRDGSIFRGRKPGQVLHPTSVWKILKQIARQAGVTAEKVYPHSLRHLFAKTYMKKVGNICELADLLGHSNIETTRIYTHSSRSEQRDALHALNL